MPSSEPVPIAQAFRMVRFGGRRDIFLHAQDVLTFLERTRDIQELPEAKQMVDSMRVVVESAYGQAIEVADAPRKNPNLLKSAAKKREKSWTAIGMDMSMTSIAVAAISFDGVLNKMSAATWGEMRWTADDGYFKRLGDAAKAHELVLDALSGIWVVNHERVAICVEEPFPMGMLNQRGPGAKFEAGWVKQQCEIAGAAKGALVRYGFPVIYEINNSQWHATLRREGVPFTVAPRGSDRPARDKVRLANKFLVKSWAIDALGIPDLPDLVRSKEGAKIPRPESGFGAKAKAVQPSDVYDAAACLAWIQDEILSGRVW